MNKRLKTVLCLMLSAALITGSFVTHTPVRAATAVDLFQKGADSKKTTLIIGMGENIDVQFNVKTRFSKIGINLNSNSSGRVLEMKLYKWDRNDRDSKKGTVISSKVYSEWNKNDLLTVETSEPQPAGEYLLSVVAKEGDNFRFTWYTPAPEGVLGYVNDYADGGAPMGSIFVDDTGSVFAAVSKQVDFPLNKAPAESVISPDSAIARAAVDSTTWSFVDGLGRPSVEYQEAGDKNNKKVGIFYWTWHYNFANNKPVNVTSILKEYPEATNDYDHSIWKKNNVGAYFWNEPLFGYYTEYDDYVLRKHAELLADAGVDFVLFDCTNGDLTWEPAYLNLLKVWSEARADGVKTPQVGFMLPFGDLANTNSSIKQIYKRIYKNGLYQDLWFYWEGKPLVMGLKDSLSSSDPLEKEIKKFFTWRRGEPEYFKDDQDDSSWGWLHIYPQALYKNADGTVEMTTVGVAMNADYKRMCLSAMNSGHNMGRGYSRQKNYSYTYTYRGKNVVASSSMENAYYYGINLQEQWDYAISVDPELVFVTGWNEWIAGRNEEWGGVKNGFPDQCDDANSRDIEPSKGDLKDHYYYQLVNNVRRFKGMTGPEVQTTAKTIDINGDTAQWNDSGIIDYNHYPNNTYERDIKGWLKTHYENPGIRNDFVKAKVTYDRENVYFYVETADAITPYTDQNWMRLLIDTSAATEDSKDWEEFEYIVGRETGTENTLSVERSAGGWNWEKAGEAAYSVSGNILQLKIPRSVLGVTGDDFSFNFKWADSNLSDGDIMTLYTDGDSAPEGRFTFTFRSTGTVIAMPEKTPEAADPAADGKKGCFGTVSPAFAMLLALTVPAFIKTRSAAAGRKKKR